MAAAVIRWRQCTLIVHAEAAAVGSVSVIVIAVVVLVGVITI